MRYIVAVSLLLFTGCGFQAYQEQHKAIQAEEALAEELAAQQQAQREAGEKQPEPEPDTREGQAWKAIGAGALLVDVRTKEEFDAGHLEGAKLIPVNEVQDRAAEFGADQSRSIVVYCRSGNRSGKAKKALEKLGYTSVHNGGGYKDLMAVKP